jgi:hypothetical protein
MTTNGLELLLQGVHISIQRFTAHITKTSMMLSPVISPNTWNRKE